MIVYTVIVLVLTLTYVVIFLFYLLGWLLLPEFHVSKKNISTHCSVIISARNEELHIGNLLSDLLSQTYPSSLFEIIVVNDFSDDRTAEIAQSFFKENV